MQKRTNENAAIAIVFALLTVFGIVVGVLVAKFTNTRNIAPSTQQQDSYEPYEPTVCIGCGVGVSIGNGISIF